ncbi:hypothetical protein BJY52DRAFT_1404674 [Lactarius psammicola]|nr:hypothetical protein BJY52DRAFT_1404674 [Lactarius psammicola]
MSLPEDIAQVAVPVSGAQPGPSGQSGSRSQEMDDAENLRLEACKQGKKRAKFLERARKAFELGNFRLGEKLIKLAEKCLKAMVEFNKKAKEIIFRVKNKGAKPGEVDLHSLHVPEAIEMAEQSVQAAMSKGDRTIRFITGKGKHSKEGPKIYQLCKSTWESRVASEISVF